MAKLIAPPPIAHPIIDKETGYLTPQWAIWFTQNKNLLNLISVTIDPP